MKKLRYLSAAILLISLGAAVNAGAYAEAAESTSVYSASAPKTTEKIVWNDVFAKNKNVLKSAFANASSGYVTFRVGGNGKIIPETNDEYTLAKFLCDMELILSEEGFKNAASMRRLC